MDDLDAVKRVLTTFAHYGFRKASMSDLAEAAGVSRQTLYNRFQTKESVLEWAMKFAARDSDEATERLLSACPGPDVTTLVAVYRRAIGELIPLFHGTPHGPEIIDLGMAAFRGSKEAAVLQLPENVANFLLQRQYASSMEIARDLTFVMDMAAKGLVMKYKSVEEFDTQMHRVVSTLLQRRQS